MDTESREVIRCSCGLNQFLTKDGLCRKLDCRRPLKSDPPNVRFSNGKPYRVTPRLSYEDPLAEADAALSTLKKILKSNVRRGKFLTKINKQPRYRSQGLSIRDFPTELRLACLEYAAAHGMTLREVVIKSLQETIDKG